VQRQGTQIHILDDPQLHLEWRKFASPPMHRRLLLERETASGVSMLALFLASNCIDIIWVVTAPALFLGPYYYLTLPVCPHVLVDDHWPNRHDACACHSNKFLRILTSNPIIISAMMNACCELTARMHACMSCHLCLSCVAGNADLNLTFTMTLCALLRSVWPGPPTTWWGCRCVSGAIPTQ
jgi:hypothetical protein